MNNHYSDRGYVALISILIISTLLLTTTLSLAQFGIAQRFFTLNNENKVVSKKLAEACAEIGYMNVYTNPTTFLTIPTTFAINDQECSITSREQAGDETVLLTTATEGTSVTTLEIAFNHRTGIITRWREI